MSEVKVTWSDQLAPREVREEIQKLFPEEKAFLGLIAPLIAAAPQPAKGKKPKFIGVFGPPGAGKTTFIHEFEDRAKGRTIKSMYISTDGMTDILLSQPAIQKVLQEAGIEEGDSLTRRAAVAEIARDMTVTALYAAVQAKVKIVYESALNELTTPDAKNLLAAITQECDTEIYAVRAGLNEETARLASKFGISPEDLAYPVLAKDVQEKADAMMENVQHLQNGTLFSDMPLPPLSVMYILSRAAGDEAKVRRGGEEKKHFYAVMGCRGGVATPYLKKASLIPEAVAIYGDTARNVLSPVLNAAPKSEFGRSSKGRDGSKGNSGPSK